MAPKKNFNLGRCHLKSPSRVVYQESDVKALERCPRDFVQVFRLLLFLLCVVLTSMAGCVEIEMNALLYPTTTDQEGQDKVDESPCNVKLKLTCIAGVVCSRDLSVQKASQSSGIPPDTVTHSRNESFAVTSCDPNTWKQLALNRNPNLEESIDSLPEVEHTARVKEDMK